MKKLFFCIFLVLFFLQHVFALSYTYNKSEENYDSDVLLRKYGQTPTADVSFSDFVYKKMPANVVFDNVYIHFAGKGDKIYELYGHVGILLEYKTGERIFFDWGNFDSTRPGFVDDFVHGNLIYTLSVHTIDFWESYLSSAGRSSRFYKLYMTDEQKRNLQNFLYFNSRPENLNYLYDFFKDNCSTRVRDILNRVYEGKLHEQFSKIPQGTYRRNIERTVRHLPFVEFIYNFGQGPSQDRPLSYYEAMFLPGYLETGLKKFVINKDVETLPAESIVYEKFTQAFGFLSSVYFPKFFNYSKCLFDDTILRNFKLANAVEDFTQGEYKVIYPEAVVEDRNLHPNLLYIYLVLVFLLLINFIDVIAGDRFHKFFKILALFVTCNFVAFFGLLSVALLFFSSFTIHTFVYFNHNLLFVNPYMFVMGYFAFRYIFEQRYEAVYIKSIGIEILLCIMAIVGKIFYRQENMYLIVFMLIYFSSLICAVYCKNDGFTINLKNNSFKKLRGK